MVRKKVDDRVRTLLENCVKTNHRSLLVLVGDAGKDQVVNLHYILSKTQVKARPTVLWCYKKELGFSTHKKKRIRQIKKMKQRGLYDPTKDDPFELFIASTSIRWTYYRDSHKILGQTFGMCVLQDFEALTPNLLARTVETVEGGGMVVLLLKSLDSLKQLYTLTMDVHSRFRTTAHDVVKPRFNERFMLSLAKCKSCLVMDDELNILPISKHMKNLTAIEPMENAPGLQLKDLKQSLVDTQPAGSLVALAKTLDQGKALVSFIEAVSEKTLNSTVTLTAARGRGKSAALGIAIASAVAFGYSNIFVTSPSPENLRTAFEFVFKGLDAIKYKEHIDYEIIQSTNEAFNKAVVRVNLFHSHRQTIQYIDPNDHEKLAQAELVVIDEAAAIPLPIVRKLIGPYLVFMASTVNGYEGTGRSLSLKLIDQLRKRAADSQSSSWRTNAFMYKGNAKEKQALAESGGVSRSSGGRTLRELELEEPIRYSAGDPVEDWLCRTLCLDATKLKNRLVSGTPHPDQCELYAVDRDTLFSHHKVSEAFLQRIMSLFVASHYKNSPNDLQLLSDAPAHRLFVLLGPSDEQGEGLPDVLCVIQVALEGGLSKEIVQSQLKLGNRSSGDLVPWMVSQQYQVDDFGKLDSARVVRIATHPDVVRMGYGRRAMELLNAFYQGELWSLKEGETPEDEPFESGHSQSETSATLLTEKIKPRKQPRPLLFPLSDMRPQRLHYVSVSFGVTDQLFEFWNKAGFKPFYVRQTPNELTGEHSCIMLCPLDCSQLENAPEEHWEESFCMDFAKRFVTLLSGVFRSMSTTLALSVIQSALATTSARSVLQNEEMKLYFIDHDMKRLDAYARNLVDYHLIADLVPQLARLFFKNRFAENVSLSMLQKALLVGIGLQGKTIDQLRVEYDAESSQLLALFNRSIRKLSTQLKTIQAKQVAKELEDTDEMKSARKVQKTLEGQNGNAAVVPKDKEALPKHLAKLGMGQYAVKGTDEDWKAALKGGLSSTVSIKAGKRKATPSKSPEEQKKKFGRRKGKHKRSKK